MFQSLGQSDEERLADSLAELKAAEAKVVQFNQFYQQVAPGGMIQVRSCDGTMKAVPLTACTLNGTSLQQCQLEYTQARENYLRMRSSYSLAQAEKER